MKKKNLVFNSVKITLFLKKIKESNVLVELKTGITCNGKLKGIDDYFNILLDKVIITSSNGELFKEALLVFIKGKAVRSLRII
nr:small nuclear ribonucleoprotein D-like protein [Cryptomonas curvata]